MDSKVDFDKSSLITVIRNGYVIDVHNGVDTIADVYIQHGRVMNIQPHNKDDTSSEKCTDCIVDGEDVSDKIDKELDASGCVVTPGLVDCHVHAYQHATPLGTDVDTTCLARGVTTVVDAGSSGSSTFAGLNNLIRARCQTKLYAFLHIAKHGLAAAGCSGLKPGGECDSLNAVDAEECHNVIQKHKDVLVGVKVRLAASVSDDGKNEQETLRRALQASLWSGMPLMVHHALSTVGHESKGDQLGCPGSLRKGDILTHCFHGHQANILDSNTGRVAQACWEARRRDVQFDVGHGQGSFSWRVAEQCFSEGFLPDTISTDLHTESEKGPAYDLLCVMTKMLLLGMPINDVIAAVTCRPAATIGKLNEIGHLGKGMPADLTLLKIVQHDIPINLEDSFGEQRPAKNTIELQGVVLNGNLLPVFPIRFWPNARTVQACQARQSQYKVFVNPTTTS